MNFPDTVGRAINQITDLLEFTAKPKTIPGCLDSRFDWLWDGFGKQRLFAWLTTDSACQ
ncbi:MAG: hypothetical protein ACKOUT_02605 [Novosphingobium sp.]